MKKSFGIRSLFLSVGFAFVAMSCSKDSDPVPQPTGSFTVFTEIPAAAFDKMEILIDGVVAGALTASSSVKPDCGAAASASVFTKQLSVGTHKVRVVQFKAGKNVGEWEEWTISLTEGQCRRTNLTE